MNAAEVKSLRQSMRLSQSDFGALIGCSQPEVSRIESGGPMSSKVRASLVLLQWLDEATEIDASMARMVTYNDNEVTK